MSEKIIIMPLGILDAATKEKLDAKGIIYIETDDFDKVKTLEFETQVPRDAMVMAGLLAANTDKYAAERFVKDLYLRLKSKEIADIKPTQQ